MSKTLLGTCCLLYVEQSSGLLEWKATTPFTWFTAEGNFISP